MKNFLVSCEVKDKVAKGGWHIRELPVEANSGSEAQRLAKSKAEMFSLDVRGILYVKENTTQKHTIEHAIRPALCTCQAVDIVACVVCGARLEVGRKHADTCSEPCYRTLLRKQREP